MSVNSSKSSECCASSATVTGGGSGDSLRTLSLPGSVQKKKPPRTPLIKLTPRAATPQKSLRQIMLYHTPMSTPTRATPQELLPKAVSMEDLTPTKRVKIESKPPKVVVAMAVADGDGAFEASRRRRVANNVYRRMVLNAWRRRRDEVRSLRKTLDYQCSCSERLRIQTYTLKSLLASDNRKVHTALREMKILNQLLHNKEEERLVLDTEKRALERDVLVEQDRASEMHIGWHNCRNELEGARGALAATEAALAAELLAVTAVRAHRDRTLQQVSRAEAEVARVNALLVRSDRRGEVLREETLAKERLLEFTLEQLEKEERLRMTERAALSARVSDDAIKMGILKRKVCELQAQQERVAAELVRMREQLDCWSRPLTKLLGAARSWLSPAILADALLWSLLPSRHSC